MLRFRLFGIPFAVDPSFWIFSAILGANAASGPNALLLLAVWVLCVFVSIVVHEMGHALVSRYYGATPTVRLYSMGGVTQSVGTFTRGQDLLRVLGGPAAGFGLYLVVRAAVGFLLDPASRWYDFLAGGKPAGIAAAEALADLLFINLYWTLFNLLPILPLDGGLILRNLLGYQRVMAARIIGAACAAVCAVYAYRVGQPYMAFFLAYLAYQNFQGMASLPGSVGR